MRKVIWTNRVGGDVLAPLSGIAEVILGPGGGDLMTREEVLRLAPDADAIVNQAELRVDAELLDAAPRLKIIANVALGTDNMDLDRMARHGVWATNAADAFVDATADFTLGLLLGVARRIHEADAYVRAGQWRGFQPGIWDGMLLSGKTLGIVGLGKIGRAVAQRARAFGMNVLGHSRSACADGSGTPLEDLLARSDVVSLHIPLTSETRQFIGAREFALMKRGAIFLNTSRGSVVDEGALVAALESNHLGGAGLDVFAKEPEVPPALRQMPNVLLAPHVGGGTRESRLAARKLCAENVALVLQGREPTSPVNRPTGNPKAV